MALKFSEYEYRPLDLETIKKEFGGLIQKFINAKNAKEQIELVKVIDEYGGKISTSMSLCSTRFNINTNDKYYAQEQERIDEISPYIQELLNEYNKAVVNSKFKKALIKEYGKQWIDQIEVNLKTFDPVIVEDLVLENKLTSQYTKLIASAKIKFKGKVYNLPGVSKFTSDKDRRTRNAATKAISNWFEEHVEEFDSIYDQLVHVRDNIAKKMGYENYVQFGYYRLGRTDYTAVDVEGYRDQVYKHLVPITKKLFKRQAKRLGIKGMKNYDYNLNFLSGNATPKGNKDQLVKAAMEMYDEMSPETSVFFRYMVDCELMDLEAKPGKMGGGYCTTFQEYKSPFIFANFNGTSGDVDVLTHEMGHAFMAYCCKDIVPSDLLWPTMEACEIHSMSMEFFAYPWIDKFFKEETEKYKFSHLSDAITFIPYGVAVDEFQHFVYENVNVTPEQRRLKWREIERKYLPHIKYSTEFMENGGRWFRQSHIFSSPFYYIDYTLAQVCAFQFFNMMREDKEKAWNTYVKLCKLGGTKSFLNLLKEVGLQNPFKKGTIKKVVKPLNEYLNTFDDTNM